MTYPLIFEGPVDEIELRDLNFIDIGLELRNRGAVPVVVKSLVFG